MSNLFSRMVRSYLTGKKTKYCFSPAQSPILGNIDQTNLYIHIPFCKNLCPYCPYNKIRYDRRLVGPYLDAVLREIEMYHRLLGQIEIQSIYIGGGTPTLLIDELGTMLQRICNRFNVTGDICIETSPNDIDDEIISKLKHSNVNLVSLGVQSFNDKYLRLIGRKYSASCLGPVVRQLLKADFKSVNIDLIFSLPGQTGDDLLNDLQKAIDLEIDQVTIYPLFTFPYSAVGRYRKLKKIKMPNLLQRHRQYHLINSFLRSNGFNRVSVWSYKKGNIPRYSSVTRDGYIGLGAGAGSDTPNGFYLNTFSVTEYINRCLFDKFPTSLHMSFNDKMRQYFWLYWRMYDTRISKVDLYRWFGQDDRKIRQLLSVLKLFKMTHENEHSIELNDRGAFWVHLFQNYFALNYINQVWAIARNEPWPQEIVL